MRNNQRRSSAFGRPSMAANFNQQSGNGSGGIMKDPRNIRDKQWMMAAIRNLVKFLAEAGYDRNISPKIFVSPSAKDFQNIFKYLYAKLDPSFDWKNKKFEEEVPVLLKGLK
jgi:kinetochore protein NDC80